MDLKQLSYAGGVSVPASVPQAGSDRAAPRAFADSAYRGSHFGDAVCEQSGTLRIVATGMWGRDEQPRFQKIKEWNQPNQRARGRIEKIIGTWERSYGLCRMGWRGIAKAAVQILLTAITYNLKRTLNIVQPAG